MSSTQEKLEMLANHVEVQGQGRLIREGLGCEANLRNYLVSLKPGKKYTKLDRGGSGHLMIDADGNIFGIKAYGVIHRGHCYGTLDTIDAWDWSGYYPQKKTLVTATC